MCLGRVRDRRQPSSATRGTPAFGWLDPEKERRSLQTKTSEMNTWMSWTEGEERCAVALMRPSMGEITMNLRFCNAWNSLCPTIFGNGKDEVTARSDE